MEDIRISGQPKEQGVRFLHFFSRSVAFAVWFLGTAVIVGWWLHIPLLKSVIPGLATMKVNTAFCFLCLGLALLTSQGAAPKGRLPFCQALSYLVVLIGIATMTEYLSSIDLRIDELLFREDQPGFNTSSPGRMAPASAVCFILVGLALAVESGKKGDKPVWTAALLLATQSISALGLLGYAFGVRSLYQISTYSSMALHTAFAMFFLSLAILISQPSRGYMKIVVSDTAGGHLARKLLPMVPVVLFGLGCLRLGGEVMGLYDSRFGIALMVLASTVVMLLLVVWQSRVLYRIDLERSGALAEINILNATLEQKVDERTKELQEALGKVKELTGLLPMCAWCNKIRDEKDSWLSVEAYVAHRTDARVTHGMCPECLAKAMTG